MIAALIDSAAASLQRWSRQLNGVLVVGDRLLEPSAGKCMGAAFAGRGQRIVSGVVTGQEVDVTGAVPMGAVRGVDEITRTVRMRSGSGLENRAGRGIEHHRDVVAAAAPHMDQDMFAAVHNRVQCAFGHPSPFRRGQFRNLRHRSTIAPPRYRQQSRNQPLEGTIGHPVRVTTMSLIERHSSHLDPWPHGRCRSIASVSGGRLGGTAGSCR
ncbi:hypothetical protein ABIA39_006880 [Nocardia sp. GAS34]|uniref:hypothetical protein n=1 Tax=unclassified Nocardia TaxID=2637762 RepID=UPI003D211AA8